MKIFVTGYQGYIGSHTVDLLKKEGHNVTGCDIGLFDGCEWEPITKPDKVLIKDIRNITIKELENFDCVMHFAAISNDPMGELNPELTYQINREGSIKLAENSKKAGVERFLFSSSCSIYGKGAKLDLDESDSTNPLTAYSISKIDTEKAVSKLADKNFTPAFLRNSTAYGFSPSLRIDLVVNNLLACAIARGDIRIMSDGSPWRPLIHCKDIAHAFIAFMNAPKEKIFNKIVNIGGNSENYQVRDVADKVQELVPQANIVYTGEVGEDPRNYRVNFDMLYSLLPDFQLEYNLDTGMEELFKKFKEHKFNLSDFEGEQFFRLRTLKKRMNLISVCL